VLISPAEPDDIAPSVQMNDEQAAFAMTEHLIGLGHSRIAFIGAVPDAPIGAPATRRRRAGFIGAMQEAGLAIPPEYEVNGDFSFRSGAECAERLLDLAPPPTAIFAGNDSMALGVMMTSARRGIQIPDQLSVAGFDDGPLATLIWPQLTTIRQPLQEMAAAGVDLLASKTMPEPPPCLTFEFELVTRESTAPPPR
jgi:LacI family transcriptional regulator